MSEYMPFSIRNNIEEEQQDQMVDYMERELGWDVEYHRYPSYANYIGSTAGTRYEIDVLNNGMLEMKMKGSTDPGARMLFIMDTALFMKAYKSLLCYYKD